MALNGFLRVLLLGCRPVLSTLHLPFDAGRAARLDPSPSRVGADGSNVASRHVGQCLRCKGEVTRNSYRRNGSTLERGGGGGNVLGGFLAARAREKKDEVK